jgi:Protein of unknown function (DUF3727)
MTHQIETIALVFEDATEVTCHVVVDLEVEGVRHMLLAPTKPFVTLVRDDADGVEEIEAKDAAELVAPFSAALLEHGLSLVATADGYRLEGELTPEVMELCDALSVSGEEEEDEETELILADIEHGGKKYFLLVPETPPLFPAKLSGAKAVMLNDEELERVEEDLAEAFEEAAS